MIVIEGNHTLTLSNIVLDGKAYRKDIDIEHCNSIISLGKSAGAEKNGAKLVLNTGSILENNNAPQLQDNAIAGYSYNTIIMNDDSSIRNNGIERGAQFGGAISLENHGNFIMHGGIIENNHAVRGGGVYLSNFQDWSSVGDNYSREISGKASFTMNGGTILNNKATYKSSNSGGIYIDHPSWRDKVATCTLLGGIVKSNTAAKGLGSDGIYQNSKLRIGKSVLIDKDNDVYLPSGRIIDAIKPLDKITNKTRVSITSEDCVIENSENPGTRLVKYHEEAGGVKAAKIAEEKQLYVPSKYMKEDLVIGKSQATDQLDFMTYIKKNKYPVVYEFVSLTDGKKIPEEVNKLLPIDDDKYIDGATVTAIQLEKNELQVEDGTWKFEGYDEKNKVASADILDENGNIKFIGKWKFEKKETPIQKPDNPTNKPDTPIVNPDNPSNTDHPTDNEETPKQKVPDKDEPKTGDETAPMMLVALLIASSAVLYVLRKKEK